MFRNNLHTNNTQLSLLHNTILLKVIFDKTKPAGDKKRILDTKLAKSYGIKNKVSLEKGLSLTINWYLKNKYLTKKRFNYFKKFK